MRPVFHRFGRRFSRALALLLGSTVACVPPAPPEPPSADEESDEPGETSPLEPATPINHEEGQALEVVLPTIDGSGVAIEALRGTVVLIELSASWDPTWDEAHTFFMTLRETHPPARLEMFVVAQDPEQRTLTTAEQGLDGVATVGWDPQGGLAAQLTVAGFPTYLVIDRKGHIAAIERGFDVEVARRLEAAVAAALQSPP